MKKLAAVILVFLAVVLIVIGIVYFTKTAGNLPHFLPGYLKDSTHMHIKHAIAFIGVAVVCLLGAWMLSGSSDTNVRTTKGL